MKKRNVSVGLPSLLVIFVVLCLVTFAVLSYVSAMRDYTLAQKTAARTQQYYEADLALKQKLSDLDSLLSVIYGKLPVKDETSFEAACKEFFPSLADNVLILEEPLGDSQVLRASLLLQLPGTAEDAFYEITGWQTVTTQNWEPDDSLPVLQAP